MLNSRWLALLAMILQSPLLGAAEYTSPSPVSDADVLAIKSILVARHPELAASPGVRYSYFSPGFGASGCEKTHAGASKQTLRWVRSETPPGRFDDGNLCTQPTADIFFDPFRENGGRRDGAFARCRAPFSERDKKSGPLTWVCDEVIFRQYVQLEEQNCEVTLVGEMSDAALRAVREMGLAAGRPENIDARSNLVKFKRLQDNRAYGVFGSADCKPSQSSYYFRLSAGTDPDLPESWALVDEL